MRIISTVLLGIGAALGVVASVFLTIDGNLARLTGWYSFKPGMPLFTPENAARLPDVTWMKIRDLNDTITCRREEDGVWWIIEPFRDRMNPAVVSSIINFAGQTRVVDTLPLNQTTRARMREYGVETTPHSFVLKVPDGNRGEHTTVARFTLGSTSPWLADAGDGRSVVPTTYLRTDFYGNDKRIHVVSGNILSMFRSGLSALRDPRPLLFTPDSLREVSICSHLAEGGETTVKICRASAETPWNIIAPCLTSADQDKMNNLVASFVSLAAVKVEDNTAVQPQGPAEYTVSFRADGSDEPVVLTIYKSFPSPADGQPLCHATVNNRPVVFTLQAEPRVSRRGSYSRIVNSICNLPVLPTRAMAQLRSGAGNIYTSELPLSLSELRSLRFSNIVDKDVSRVVLRVHDSDESLRLMLIPGDVESEVSDMWMYSVGNTRFAEADELVVRRFLNGLGTIPVRGIEADMKPGENPREFMARYGLNNPYYTLFLSPRPCFYRATLFGVDLPLVKDRDTRIFYISRYRDPQTGRFRWVGMENGGSTIYWLSTRLTRTFSLSPNNWRARNVVNFPISALRKLTLGYQQAPLELHYDYIGESWTGTLGGEDVTPRINPHRAQYYIRQLQKLKVSEWLDKDDEFALQCLQNPVFSVRLNLELTDYSRAEAVVMDSSTLDHENLTPGMGDSRTQMAEGALTESTATDEALREAALQEHPTISKTITIEIAPSTEASDEPFFYGRVVETGELFVLPYADAQGLDGNILDM